MNITPINNNTDFRARCPEIREAQDILHIVKSQVPVLSLTWFQPMLNKLSLGQYPISQTLCNKYVNGVNSIITDKFQNNRPGFSTYGFFESDYLIQFLKEMKMGNCGELSTLTNIVMQMNGYKNVYAGPLNLENTRIDHAVCYFNYDDTPFKINPLMKYPKTIIIDAWCGIVDFANNYFGKIGSILEACNIVIPSAESQCGRYMIDGYFNIDFTPKELNRLRKTYPELLLAKNKSPKKKRLNIFN